MANIGAVKCHRAVELKIIRTLCKPGTCMALIGFSESTYLPFPSAYLLVFLCLKYPAKAYSFAFIAALSSIAGSIYGYSMGYFGYGATAPGQYLWLFNNWNLAMIDGYERWGVVLALFWAILPIPFHLTASSAGEANIGLIPFVFSCTIGRFFHFYLFAFLSSALVGKLIRKNKQE